MQIKKIGLIIILIILISGLTYVFIKINNESRKKIHQKASLGTNIIGNPENKIINKKDFIEITDNFFIEATNDIYINVKDYLGKTVKMEGLIYTYVNEVEETCFAVIRNTPGCCGNDGLAGLDIKYDKQYPEPDTWVEVIGVVETKKSNGANIPILNIKSLEIKPRGVDFVTT